MLNTICIYIYIYIKRAICLLIRFSMIFPRLFFSHTFLRFFLPSLSSVWVLLCICLSIVDSSDQSIKHGHSIDKRERKKNENGIFGARTFLIISFTHHRLKTASHTHIKINDVFSFIFIVYVSIYIYIFNNKTRWSQVMRIRWPI